MKVVLRNLDKTAIAASPLPSARVVYHVTNRGLGLLGGLVNHWRGGRWGVWVQEGEGERWLERTYATRHEARDALVAEAIRGLKSRG